MSPSPTPIGVRCNACNCTWIGTPLPSLFDDCPQCGKSDVLRPDYEIEREVLTGAFDALLSLVVKDARLAPGGSIHRARGLRVDPARPGASDLGALGRVARRC